MIQGVESEQIKLLNIRRDEIVKDIQRSKYCHTLGSVINTALKARTTPNLIFYGFSRLDWNSVYIASIFCQSYVWELVTEYDTHDRLLSVRNSEYEPVPQRKLENRWREGHLDAMTKAGMLPEILDEFERHMAEERMA